MKHPELHQAIVLGGGLEDDGTLSDQSRQRAVAAALFSHKYDVDRIVFSGGNSYWEPENRLTESEAEQMADVADWHGLRAETVLRETESQDTFENFAYSKPLLIDTNPTAVITHRYHVPRSLVVARAILTGPVLGIAVRPYQLSPVALAREAVLFATTKAILAGVEDGDSGAVLARKNAIKRTKNSASGLQT
jgi:uncharacterized SAM-binding protein YcdF (DUF218 family)